MEPAPRKARTLRIAPWLLALPFIGSLIAGSVVDVAGLALGLACCYGGTRLIERGRQAEADYLRRAIARAPRLPRKLLGGVLVGLGVLVASLLASSAGLAASLLFACTALAGCLLAYGLDPRQLQRIADRARAILAEIEQDPGDVRRARRFLVTYLDGTREVAQKYATQEEDLADAPLADNFRRVLETIETVFAEQQAVLRKSETLDLEVRIEVLQTQLRREGVA